MGRAVDPAKEVLVVIEDGEVATRVSAAIGDAGFVPIRAGSLEESRRLLDEGHVRPCVILLFLSLGVRWADLVSTFAGSATAAKIPLVMFSTGEDAPLLSPNPALVTTLVKMVEQHCTR